MEPANGQRIKQYRVLSNVIPYHIPFGGYCVRIVSSLCNAMRSVRSAPLSDKIRIRCCTCCHISHLASENSNRQHVGQMSHHLEDYV